MNDGELPAESEHHLHLFKRSVPLQVALQEVVRATGGTDGLSCLDIGADNGMFSYQLRKQGGTWQTLARRRDCFEAMKPVLRENVHHYQPPKFPFENKAFDIVVVAGSLERADSDEAFIEECHRVLKPDGRLVVSVTHLKPLSIVTWLRMLAGPPAESSGLVRRGYGESELFRILKNGFDVMHVRSYQRFFVELVDILTRRLVGQRDSTVAGRSIRRLYSAMYPFYRLAYQFDMLLLFTRGFRLIATAKRRVWLPRSTPVLVDGRSISEAVLSKASN